MRNSIMNGICLFFALLISGTNNIKIINSSNNRLRQHNNRPAQQQHKRVTMALKRLHDADNNNNNPEAWNEELKYTHNYDAKNNPPQSITTTTTLLENLTVTYNIPVHEVNIPHQYVGHEQNERIPSNTNKNSILENFDPNDEKRPSQPTTTTTTQFPISSNPLPSSIQNCPDCKTISTTSLTGELQSYGHVFNVKALHPLTVRTMAFVTARRLTNVTFRVWTHPGSFSEEETQTSMATSWTLVASGSVEGRGDGNLTLIPWDMFVPVTILRKGGAIQAFYLTLTTPDVIYEDAAAAANGENGQTSATTTMAVNDVFERNEDLEIMAGFGVIMKDFGHFTPSPRLWRGCFYYSISNNDFDDMTAAERQPSSSPTTPFDERSTTVVYKFIVNKYPLSRVELNKIDMLVAGKLNYLFKHNRQDTILDSLFSSNGDSLTIRSVSSQSLQSPNNGQPMLDITVDATYFEDYFTNDQMIRFALLYYANDVADAIDLAYIGPKTVQTHQTITVYDVADNDNLNANETNRIERLTRKFLNEILLSSSQNVTILSVSLIGQRVGSSYRRRRRRMRRHLLLSSETTKTTTTSWMTIEFFITGEYNPPPYIDFDNIINDSFNDHSHDYLDELKNTSIRHFENATRLTTTTTPIDDNFDLLTTKTTPSPSSSKHDNNKMMPIYVGVSFIVLGSLLLLAVYSYIKINSHKNSKDDSNGNLRFSSVFKLFPENLQKELSSTSCRRTNSKENSNKTIMTSVSTLANGGGGGGGGVVKESSQNKVVTFAKEFTARRRRSSQCEMVDIAVE